MTENRTVIAQFCDDVRQEIGNKFSLMGCYGTDLYVPKFPHTLAKLCVFVIVRTPAEEPFRSLVIRVVRDQEVLAELAADPDRLASADQPPEWARWISMTSILVVAPLRLAAPCHLRVQAETEAGVVESGRFLIKQMPAPGVSSSD
ncbi:MAG: hypothetical protein L0271_26155 [Gemmatimonadetes bacterium]|nr:hypothetical protein [Gemmatimonadota bacterium]